MARQTAERRRIKVSVTVDPALLREIDAFVAKHPETVRSKVFEEALYLWYGQRLEEAIAEQHMAPQSDIEREEHEAWRRIQAAAAERVFWPK